MRIQEDSDPLNDLWERNNGEVSVSKKYGQEVAAKAVVRMSPSGQALASPVAALETEALAAGEYLQLHHQVSWCTCPPMWRGRSAVGPLGGFQGERESPGTTGG